MDPFVRFTATGKIFPNKFLTVAYDAKFIYIYSGKGKIEINGKTYPLDNGTLCYIPSGNSYFPFISETPSSKFSVINFDLSTEFCNCTNILYPVRAEEYNPGLAILSHTNCEIEMFRAPFVCQKAFFVEELISSAVSEFDKKTKYCGEISASYLKCAILNLAEFKSDKTHTLFSKIEKYICANYATVTSDSQIAKALNYHPYHINRVLKEHCGITLHKYVVKYRIKVACQLLCNTNLKINEIAKRVGYENQNQFSNIFSKEIGISPTKYREMNLFF